MTWQSSYLFDFFFTEDLRTLFFVFDDSPLLNIIPIIGRGGGASFIR
jgi:hypothetical protein